MPGRGPRRGTCRGRGRRRAGPGGPGTAAAPPPAGPARRSRWWRCRCGSSRRGRCAGPVAGRRARARRRGRAGGSWVPVIPRRRPRRHRTAGPLGQGSPGGGTGRRSCATPGGRSSLAPDAAASARSPQDAAPAAGGAAALQALDAGAGRLRGLRPRRRHHGRPAVAARHVGAERRGSPPLAARAASAARRAPGRGRPRPRRRRRRAAAGRWRAAGRPARPAADPEQRGEIVAGAEPAGGAGPLVERPPPAPRRR